MVRLLENQSLYNNVKEKLLRDKLTKLVNDIVVPYFAEQLADHFIDNNVDIVIFCDSCQYLRECRSCFRCEHPHGLKEPNPNIGTYCFYGVEKENAESSD